LFCVECPNGPPALKIESPMYGRNVIEMNHRPGLADDAEAIAEMRQNLREGDAYVVHNFMSPEKVRQIRSYLTEIGRHSLPNYEAIEHGCPNFHRVNVWDERAYVKGCFHQFSFFPWNQDVFQFFDLTRDIFRVKNVLNGLPKDKFLGPTPEDGCTARLSFQFYPSGGGGMHMHADPVDHHQLTASLLIMTDKGEDFKTGGGYVALDEDKKLYFDDIAKSGDVVHINAKVFHGVEKVDPGDDLDWLAFNGRWMSIFAVNQVASVETVAEAVDLES